MYNTYIYRERERKGPETDELIYLHKVIYQTVFACDLETRNHQ